MLMKMRRLTSLPLRSRTLAEERVRTMLVALRILPGWILALAFATCCRILKVRHLPGAKRHSRVRRGRHATISVILVQRIALGSLRRSGVFPFARLIVHRTAVRDVLLRMLLPSFKGKSQRRKIRSNDYRNVGCDRCAITDG